MYGGHCLVSSPRPDGATASSDVLLESTSIDAVPGLPTPPLQAEVNVPVAENWCYIQAKVIEFSCTLTTNHTSIRQEDSGLKCPTFHARSKRDLKRCLKVNPNQTDEENKDNTSLYRLLVSKEKSEFFSKFEFSSPKVNKEETKIMNSPGTFRFSPGKDSGFDKFIATGTLLDRSNELPDCKHTSYFEVSVRENVKALSEHNNIVRFKIPTCRLSDDFINLSEGSPFSEAPSAMFEHETEEEQLLSGNKSEFRAEFNFSILNANRGETEMVDSHGMFRFVQGKDRCFDNSLQTDILRDKANGLLPEDKLSIYREVRVLGNAKNTYDTNDHVQFKIAQWRLSEDFGDLIDSHKVRDVIMSDNGLEYYAHEAILSTKSPVPAAIVKHETEEKEGEVEVTDTDHEALHGMLLFIYTGQTPNLNSMDDDLLAGTDKYALEYLKITREQDLRLRLSA